MATHPVAKHRIPAHDPEPVPQVVKVDESRRLPCGAIDVEKFMVVPQRPAHDRRTEEVTEFPPTSGHHEWIVRFRLEGEIPPVFEERYEHLERLPNDANDPCPTAANGTAGSQPVGRSLEEPTNGLPQKKGRGRRSDQPE
jgi:hypothetical protein